MDHKAEFLIILLLSTLISISPFIKAVAFPEALHNYTNPYGKEPWIINVHEQTENGCIDSGGRIDLLNSSWRATTRKPTENFSNATIEINNEVAGWVAAKLPEDGGHPFLSAPPCIVRGPRMRLEKPVEGLEDISVALGTWYGGSNVVFIADDVGEGNVLYHHILHEQLHYASTTAAFINYGNGSWWMLGWLGEGITEHYTLKILKENGMEYDTNKYAGERKVVDEVALIVGEEELERAYFSGDFKTVEERLDKALGKGSSSELRKQPNAEQAVELIRRGLDSK